MQVGIPVDTLFCSGQGSAGSAPVLGTGYLVGSNPAVPIKLFSSAEILCGDPPQAVRLLPKPVWHHEESTY